MKSKENMEKSRQLSFSRVQFCLVPILVFIILSILLVPGCSEKKETPPAPEVSKETPKIEPPKETQTQPSLMDAYWAALKDIERTTGKQSSHSLYSQMSFVSKAQPEETLLECVQWVLYNSWIDGSTSSSIVLEGIRENQNSLDLLSKGAQLDNPVLPRIGRMEMVVPNWKKIYTIALLRLAEAKYSAAQKMKDKAHPDISLEEEAEIGLETLQFGCHFMCDNATLIHYLLGNIIRSSAADFLIWVVENDQRLSIDRLETINQILSLEEKRNSMFQGWYDDLSAFRDIQLELYGKIFPRDPKPEFMNLLRKKLSEDMHVSSPTLTREQILDLYSTNTLARYFNEFLDAGKAFADLSSAERERETGKYEEQAVFLSPGRSPYLKNTAIPTVTAPLRMEQIVTTKLRLVVSALAIQESIARKRAATPIKSMKALYLDEAWAKDPFTDQELTIVYHKFDKMMLNGDKPSWFYTIAPGYTQNYDFEIEFPIPQSQVKNP